MIVPLTLLSSWISSVYLNCSSLGLPSGRTHSSVTQDTPALMSRGASSRAGRVPMVWKTTSWLKPLCKTSPFQSHFVNVHNFNDMCKRRCNVSWTTMFSGRLFQVRGEKSSIRAHFSDIQAERNGRLEVRSFEVRTLFLWKRGGDTNLWDEKRKLKLF